MKAIGLILTLLTLLGQTAVFGEEDEVQVVNTYYHVTVSQINAGTGHGNGYTVSAGLVKGRKSLEVGVIYSEREEKLAGCDVKYRIFLGNAYRLEDVYKVYRPYLQYNMLYQKGISYSPDIMELNGELYEIPTEPGMIATIGHYVGYGNKIRITGRTYLDSSLGFGFYQGSLDKVNGPGTWGIHNTNNGFTFSFKIGVGYTFN
jgi:hypothetical protein